MPRGKLMASEAGNVVTVPVVVIFPTVAGYPACVNHRLPSLPTVTDPDCVNKDRPTLNPVKAPPGVRRPIAGSSFAARSVNQRLPSGPVTMPLGVPLGSAPDGMANSVTTPPVVIRPIFPPNTCWCVGKNAGGWLLGKSVAAFRAFTSVNHRAPSGPTVIEIGLKPLVGTWNSVMTPDVVMRPIWSTLASVNQRLPSGPATMPVGPLAAVGTANSVTAPLVVMRPIWSALASVNQRLPSGPATMPVGAEAWAGRLNVLNVDGTERSSSASQVGRNRCRFAGRVRVRGNGQVILHSC